MASSGNRRRLPCSPFRGLKQQRPPWFGDLRRRCLRFRDQPDGPEIARKGTIEKIGVGHGAVALHAPIGAPGIARDEALLIVEIADCHHRVAAEELLALLRHRHLAALRDGLAFEALIDGEAKDERKAVSEAGHHLRQMLSYAAVAD